MNLVPYDVSVYLCVKNHRFLVLGPHVFGMIKFHDKRVLQHEGVAHLAPWGIRCRCGSLTKKRLKAAAPAILTPAWVLGGYQAVSALVPGLTTPIRYPVHFAKEVPGIPVVPRGTWPADTFV